MCNSPGEVSISLGEDHICSDHMYNANVANGNCIHVPDHGGACICYDWDLACTATDTDYSNTKALAASDEPEEVGWEDIELYTNVYYNENACNYQKTFFL